MTARTPAGERQHRERAARSEALEGAVRVRLVGGDVGDQRHLRVVLHLGTDAGRGAHLRMRAVGGDHEARLEELRSHPRCAHPETHARRIDRKLGELRGDAQRQPGGPLEALPQRRAEEAVGHHVAERLDPLLARLQAREAEMSGIRDVDRADRAGPRRDRLPHPEGCEDAPAGIAQRGGALIEARLLGAGEGHALDQERAHAAADERQRQARADHAAADDRNVDLSGHSAVGGHGRASQPRPSALRSGPASFGAGRSAPRTPRVTTTSSSMRMPMFQKRFGTPRVPAGR